MLKRKIGCLILCAILLAISGCKKAPTGDFQTIRLADSLKIENIVSSLFLEEKDFPQAELLYPLQSFPLKDSGAEENPFRLKRKLDLGTAEIDILFAPPRSEYAYTVTLPEKSVLEFGTGIIRDKNYETLREHWQEDADGVNFRVVLEVGDTKKTLFQKTLNLPPAREERTRTFATHRVDLPTQSQKARLTLITSGQKGAFSFWHNPVIYTSGKAGLNVILISLDTLRADHLGCYGYGKPTSPQIDALASDSALFLNTYSSSTWTLPAHVSLFTSFFDVHHQVYDTADKLDPSFTTLAERLKQNHYFCAAFTGGAYVSHRFGLSQGFEIYSQAEGIWDLENSAERLSASASDWIGRNKDKKFFLFLHTYQTHSPYACPEPYATMFLENPLWPKLDIIQHVGGNKGIFKTLSEEERRNVIGLYDGEIRYTDEKLVGPLVARLKELGIYDNTMIVLLSDHGEEFSDHLAWIHGVALYDECLKVPLLIKFPGSKFRGRKLANIVRLVDVTPTILEALGIDPGPLDADGKSLSPVLRGKDKKDRIFVADICGFRLGGCGQPESVSSDAPFPQKVTMNFQKWKLILNKELSQKEKEEFDPQPPAWPAVELYDLGRDPAERQNIVSEQPAVANRMFQQLRELYKKGRLTKGEKAQIDKALEEQLRALGYIR